MSKQGHDTSPIGQGREADRQALDRFRQNLSDARGELDALQRDAQATIAEVREAMGPVGPLTDATRALSMAIQDLECQLQTFAQRGTPVYLGPPPATRGGGLMVTLFFLLGLCGVMGWVLFGADPDPPARSIIRLPDDPLLPRRAPLPADPADLVPVPPPPAPVAPLPRRDADA